MATELAEGMTPSTIGLMRLPRHSWRVVRGLKESAPGLHPRIGRAPHPGSERLPAAIGSGRWPRTAREAPRRGRQVIVGKGGDGGLSVAVAVQEPAVRVDAGAAGRSPRPATAASTQGRLLERAACPGERRDHEPVPVREDLVVPRRPRAGQPRALRRALPRCGREAGLCRIPVEDELPIAPALVALRRTRRSSSGEELPRSPRVSTGRTSPPRLRCRRPPP